MILDIVLGFLAYFVIAGAIYASDGWFKFEIEEPGLFFATIVWPIGVWFLLGEAIKRKLKTLREDYDEKQKQKKKIRVALDKEIELKARKVELEIAEIEKQLEQELRSSYKTKHV